MTTTNERQIEMFEDYMKELEYIKDIKDSLVKLSKTPEYQKVFNHYVFDVKLKHFVNELATTTAEPLVRKVQAQIASIAHIQHLLKDIIIAGNNAESQMSVTQEEFISCMRNEGEADE